MIRGKVQYHYSKIAYLSITTNRVKSLQGIGTGPLTAYQNAYQTDGCYVMKPRYVSDLGIGPVRRAIQQVAQPMRNYNTGQGYPPCYIWYSIPMILIIVSNPVLLHARLGPQAPIAPR